MAVSILNITTATQASAGSLISPSNVQPDIATPAVLSWTFKVEQQVAANTSLTVAYVGSHGYHQILSEDQNEPAAVTCPNPACPADIAGGTVFYPHDHQSKSIGRKHYVVGLARYQQLRCARSGCASKFRERTAVPWGVHVVEEPGQWVGVEHECLV